MSLIAATESLGRGYGRWTGRQARQRKEDGPVVCVDAGAGASRGSKVRAEKSVLCLGFHTSPREWIGKG